MKKPIPVGAIVGIIAAALAAVGYFFMKGAGDPPQTMQNMPDLSKMSPADIAKQRQAANSEEAAAMKQAGR